jgi:hypothetical protein
MIEDNNPETKTVNYTRLFGEMLIYLFLFGLLESLKKYYDFDTKYLAAIYVSIGILGLYLVSKN